MMESTGMTMEGPSTTRKSIDALSFITDDIGTNTQDVRLLCVILRRSSCPNRRGVATALLLEKLRDSDNRHFFLDMPDAAHLIQERFVT